MSASAAIDLVSGAASAIARSARSVAPCPRRFSRTEHAHVAEAFGVEASRVDDPAALRGALAAALNRDGPALVDVIAQPLHEAHAPVSESIV